jgi:hypothetical protein
MADDKNAAGPATFDPDLDLDTPDGTRAQKVRYWIARVAFLREFLRDEKVEALFAHWTAQLGIPIEDRSFIETKQVRLALAQWTAECDRGWALPLDPEFVDHANRVRASCAELLDRSTKAINEATQPGPFRTSVFEEALAFVKSLGLPYRWLAAELGREFGRRIRAWLRGEPFDQDLDRELEESADPPAGSVSVRFRSGGQGESLSVAKRRLYETYAAALEHLQSATYAAGTTSYQRESVERDARWFYLLKVKRHTLHQIAANTSREQPCDYTAVQYGTSRVASFFKLAPRTASNST